ncbi:MAG: LD-carboxypeptidase [Firmicutes bacterium]|nr:LD-carboxypeptidase [Bacillota bacterium]MDD7601768.1 LD-carboxypeptidase [Bacillota bacterium]MDY5855478.1 LD-carboxypeptidase [Anaerovoracaceae bacterium]
MMKYPKTLKKGATIGLIATSSDTETARVAACVKKLEDMGYKVKAADNLDSNYGGYMAGTGEIRGQWVNRMFADPEVDAIFCIRGGDGSSRIMEYLDYDMIRQNPKIFLGYSDVTNLHLALNQKCDLVTFHGPMVSSNMVDSFDEETEKSLFQALNAEEDYTFSNPEGFPIEVLKEGKATGKLIGGNLSLLSASIGTPYEMDTKNKIVFIEEVCEPISKIEKWAYHLRNAGKFRECSGVILGQFTKIVNEDLPEFDSICCMKDVLEGLDIPVLYNVQSGHSKPMMTLPMGAVCTIDTSAPSIRFKVER